MLIGVGIKDADSCLEFVGGDVKDGKLFVVTHNLKKTKQKSEFKLAELEEATIHIS
jgi:hypothetical protein